MFDFGAKSIMSFSTKSVPRGMALFIDDSQTLQAKYSRGFDCMGHTAFSPELWNIGSYNVGHVFGCTRGVPKVLYHPAETRPIWSIHGFTNLLTGLRIYRLILGKNKMTLWHHLFWSPVAKDLKIVTLSILCRFGFLAKGSYIVL